MAKDEELVKAGVAGVIGAGLGYGTVKVAGITAIGAVGNGAGIGTAAGPVGVVLGALVAGALYGAYRLFND